MSEHIRYEMPQEWAYDHAVLRNAIIKLLSDVQARLNSERILRPGNRIPYS